MTGDGGSDCIMNSERKLLAAIRARCMDCSGHCKKEVEHCLIPECALYPYRMGGRNGIEGRADKRAGQHI